MAARADPLHEPVADTFENLVRVLDERALWLPRLATGDDAGRPGASCDREVADAEAAVARAGALHTAWLRGDLRAHTWPHVKRAPQEVVAEAERRVLALRRYGDIPPALLDAFEHMLMRHLVATWDDVAAGTATDAAGPPRGAAGAAGL